MLPNTLADFDDLPDLDLDDLDPKIGIQTGFFVGEYVGLRVVGKRRKRDGREDMEGVVEGPMVGLIVGLRVGDIVG